MKPTMSISTEGLRQRFAALEKEAPRATMAGIKVMGREFARALMVYASEHQDTRRYFRGWALAINEAGVGPVAVPAIEDSKYADWLLGRLEDRVEKFKTRLADKKKAAEFWQRVYENRYGRESRKDRWERDCAKKRDAAAKEAEKAQELLARAEEVVKNFDPKGIVIWGRDSYDGKIRFREVHTQRLKVYGGTGYAVAKGESAYLVLHNLEAHGSLVEKEFRIVGRAFASVKRPGVQRAVKDRIVKDLIKAQRRADVAAASA